jgi:hypothetical protein
VVMQVGLDVGSTMADRRNTYREKGQKWVFFPALTIFYMSFKKLFHFTLLMFSHVPSTCFLRKKTTIETNPDLNYLIGTQKRTEREGKR